jgi:hypothetical protein
MMVIVGRLLLVLRQHGHEFRSELLGQTRAGQKLLGNPMVHDAQYGLRCSLRLFGGLCSSSRAEHDWNEQRQQGWDERTPQRRLCGRVGRLCRCDGRRGGCGGCCGGSQCFRRWCGAGQDEVVD